MAQKVQVILTDDIDGGDATETVSFALDGITYEIDLSEANATALRESVAQYVGAGRKIGKPTGGGRSGGRTRSDRAASKHDLAEVRTWARENGFQVSDRGRVSGDIMTAYEAAR